MCPTNQFQTVELVFFEEIAGGRLAKDCYKICNFCNKTFFCPTKQKYLREKLFHDSNFYCNFCFRNKFRKNKSPVVIFSYRPIISLYYKELYVKSNKLWLSQIQNYIKDHQSIGLANPLFNYDPETYFWFIDFSCVDDKIFEDIVKVHEKILSTFNLSKHLSEKTATKIDCKFKTGLQAFYNNELLNKFLIPSLGKIPEYPDHDALTDKDFTPDKLLDKILKTPID